LTTDEAKSFFAATALEHSMLTFFYILEAVYWTVEAGRITRNFVDSFSTPKTEAVEDEVTVIAGLLAPAEETAPITTEAVVVSNQQKLEQQLSKTIREIHEVTKNIEGFYDNVQSNQDSVQLGEETNHPPLEEISVLPVRGVEADQDQTQPVPTRTRKPRASSGNTGKAENQTPSGRVSRARSSVRKERHENKTDV
jgi:hypothetical protein